MDVIFNLERNTCRPHKKANDNIDISSNHPPQIIKHFAQTISKNSFRNSSRAKIFQQSKPDYEEALKKRGYKAKLQHMQPNLEQNNARRTRKSIWFNLSFSLNVKTNVAKIFVELIDTYFPPANKLLKAHKIFNCNTVKVSYSCTQNTFQIVKGHYKKVTQIKRLIITNNSDNKSDCPVNGGCMKENVMDKCPALTTFPPKKVYLGLLDGEFKNQGYYNQI